MTRKEARQLKPGEELVSASGERWVVSLNTPQALILESVPTTGYDYVFFYNKECRAFKNFTKVNGATTDTPNHG